MAARCLLEAEVCLQKQQTEVCDHLLEDRSWVTVVRQQTFLESNAAPLKLFEVFWRARAETHCCKKWNTTHWANWVTYKALSSSEQETVEKAFNGSYFYFSTKQHCQIKHFSVSATLNWKQHSAGLPSILKQECSLAKAWSKMQNLPCVRHTIDTWTAVCPDQDLSGARWWLLLNSCGCLPCSCWPWKKQLLKKVVLELYYSTCKLGSQAYHPLGVLDVQHLESSEAVKGWDWSASPALCWTSVEDESFAETERAEHKAAQLHQVFLLGCACTLNHQRHHGTASNPGEGTWAL